MNLAQLINIGIIIFAWRRFGVRTAMFVLVASLLPYAACALVGAT